MDDGLVTIRDVAFLMIERGVDGTLIMRLSRRSSTGKVSAEVFFEIDESPKLVAALMTLVTTDEVMGRGRG